MIRISNVPTRHDWTLSEVQSLFKQSFNDLIFQAQSIHRQCFPGNNIQISTLLSIKTGSCPEDCKYCPQSARHPTNLESQPLMSVETVLAKAECAKTAGATRFCMGAAWRNPKEHHMPVLCDMVKKVKALGIGTCMTLGMLTEKQAEQLASAGLDYYNHNIDTSEDFYNTIISTRTFQSRLETLQYVRNSGMKICCGGIVGMGESLKDRASMLMTLANLPDQPESIPINRLVRVEGTPLAGTAPPLADFDFIRTIAVTRILMPHSYVRISAGRQTMSDTMQALCFLAGANSVFCGEKMLTTANPEEADDMKLFDQLGMTVENVVA